MVLKPAQPRLPGWCPGETQAHMQSAVRTQGGARGTAGHELVSPAPPRNPSPARMWCHSRASSKLQTGGAEGPPCPTPPTRRSHFAANRKEDRTSF